MSVSLVILPYLLTLNFSAIFARLSLSPGPRTVGDGERDRLDLQPVLRARAGQEGRLLAWLRHLLLLPPRPDRPHHLRRHHRQHVPSLQNGGDPPLSTDRSPLGGTDWLRSGPELTSQLSPVLEAGGELSTP